MRKCILVQFSPKEKSEDKGQELCITLRRLVVSLGYRAGISIVGTNGATVMPVWHCFECQSGRASKGTRETDFFFPY